MALVRVLMRLEAVMAALAYAVTASLLLADVIARELFAQSLWGAQQTAVLCSILAGMLGLTLATGRSAHFRPEFADGLIRAKWVDRLGDLISALLFAVFTFYAFEFVLESRDFGDTVPVMGMILWPFQIVVLYAMGSSALKHLVFALTPEVKTALKKA